MGWCWSHVVIHLGTSHHWSSWMAWGHDTPSTVIGEKKCLSYPFNFCGGKGLLFLFNLVMASDFGIPSISIVQYGVVVPRQLQEHSSWVLAMGACRLLIPCKMQRDILAQLHESGQGSVCTKQWARLTMYWPGIDNDIVLACKQCQNYLPSNPREPITFKPKPSCTILEAAGYFCSYAGQDYPILVDRYSDRPDTASMDHIQYYHLSLNGNSQTILLNRSTRHLLV